MCVSPITHVFLPEYFAVRRDQAELRIFSQTYFCRGVRFFFTAGEWSLIQPDDSLSQRNHKQVHWLRILYAYRECEKSTDDRINAFVFRENSRIILEIIRHITSGSVIRAKFHQLTPHDISFVPESIRSIADSNPLDLSQRSSAPSTISDYIKSRVRKKYMLPCNLCGKKFDRPSLLQRHVRTHTGERPHVCEVCGKGFSTSSSLNTHKRIHSGERPHQCVTCGKRFTASSNLYYHRLTHSADKPHKCDTCGKSFPTPGNLRSHKYLHGGVFMPLSKCTKHPRGYIKLVNLKNTSDK